MSRNFTLIPAQQLTFRPQSFPASLLNPASIKPAAVFVQIGWASYGGGSAKPDVNVLVNVSVGGPRQPIDIIRSVKIDNLGNPNPVYVYFTDTADTIVAPPNTIVWEPVVTNQKVANVICLGMTDGATGNSTIYFTNFMISPYVDREVDQALSLYRGSTVIQRTNSLLPGFGVPALGDQTAFSDIFAQDPATLPPVANTILGPATGWYYITSMFISCRIGVAALASAGFVVVNGKFYDTGTGSVIVPYTATIVFGVLTSNAIVFQASDFNLRLDATHAYQFTIDSVASNGPALASYYVRMFLWLSYSLNPN